jgi:hypothetical protein
LRPSGRKLFFNSDFVEQSMFNTVLFFCLDTKGMFEKKYGARKNLLSTISFADSKLPIMSQDKLFPFSEKLVYDSQSISNQANYANATRIGSVSVESQNAFARPSFVDGLVHDHAPGSIVDKNRFNYLYQGTSDHDASVAQDNLRTDIPTGFSSELEEVARFTPNRFGGAGQLSDVFQLPQAVVEEFNKRVKAKSKRILKAASKSHSLEGWIVKQPHERSLNYTIHSK